LKKSTSQTHNTIKYIAILTIVLLIGTPQNLLAQDRQKAKYESLIRLGDSQFDVGYYQKAEGFYLRAHKINSGDARLNYQVGECKRLTFKYEEALEYYKTTTELDLENYPLALFIILRK